MGILRQIQSSGISGKRVKQDKSDRLIIKGQYGSRANQEGNVIISHFKPLKRIEKILLLNPPTNLEEVGGAMADFMSISAPAGLCTLLRC
jgi:hypothetical protein